MADAVDEALQNPNVGSDDEYLFVDSRFEHKDWELLNTERVRHKKTNDPAYLHRIVYKKNGWITIALTPEFDDNDDFRRQVLDFVRENYEKKLKAVQ